MNTSISSPYFDCTQTLNAANVNIGNTAISTVGGNLNVDVQTPDGFIYFIINGHNVASLTGRNTIVNCANLCGLDMQQTIYTIVLPT